MVVKKQTINMSDSDSEITPGITNVRIRKSKSTYIFMTWSSKVNAYLMTKKLLDLVVT